LATLDFLDLWDHRVQRDRQADWVLQGFQDQLDLREIQDHQDCLVQRVPPVYKVQTARLEQRASKDRAEMLEIQATLATPGRQGHRVERVSRDRKELLVERVSLALLETLELPAPMASRDLWEPREPRDHQVLQVIRGLSDRVGRLDHKDLRVSRD